MASPDTSRGLKPTDDDVNVVHRTTARISTVAALFVILTGTLTLLGWIADIPRLMDWTANGITQKPNNAVAAILSASAILLLVRGSALTLPRLLAAAAAAIGGITLLQHVTGYNTGIDTLLFYEPPGAKATVAPGRMGPIASLSYLLIGAALLLYTTDPRARRIAHTLALLTFILNGIPLLGYLYGADPLYTVPRITGIAFQTATLFIALSIGVMALIPEHEMTSLLTRQDPGGVLFRRMIIPIIVLPILLGWFRLRGEQLGLYDAAFGTAALTFLLTMVLGAVLASGVRRVSEAAAIISEQSEQLRMTLASIGDGVITADQHGVITMINGIAEKLTAWNSSQAIGRPLSRVFRIVNEQTRGEVENPAFRALREGVIVGLANHSVLCARDGSERPIDDSAAPIRLANGEVIGCVLIFRDVTERRQAERALRDADRRKDEFLATLAHELRNPLAPMRNSLHVMKTAGEDTEIRERMLQMMERQVNHMVRLVDDLLEVSRITRGMIELRREKVDLESVVRSAVEIVESAVQAAGVELAITLPPEPLILEADAVRLAQVIANVLNNAAKYTDVGGRVSLTARQEDNAVLIAVRDTGIGIPHDMLERVFDLFTRVDHIRGRAQSGMGIGLALVKSLVLLHGGTVEARSDGPGHGSEFIIRLRLAQAGAAQLSKARLNLPPVTLKNRRILVVDDNRDAADSLCMLLALEGAEVQQAYDGPAALNAMRTYRPEIVLLDIGMPDMDGYAIAVRIRREPEFKRVILVALTGWGQHEDRRRSREAGFDAHLIKPPDPKGLVQLLASFRT